MDSSARRYKNYNPANPEFGGSYTLTTHSGDSITIDPTQGVIDSVTDLNNNTLTYTNNGVFSSSGAHVYVYVCVRLPWPNY